MREREETKKKKYIYIYVCVYMIDEGRERERRRDKKKKEMHSERAEWGTSEMLQRMLTYPKLRKPMLPVKARSCWTVLERFGGQHGPFDGHAIHGGGWAHAV